MRYAFPEGTEKVSSESCFEGPSSPSCFILFTQNRKTGAVSWWAPDGPGPAGAFRELPGRGARFQAADAHPGWNVQPGPGGAQGLPARSRGLQETPLPCVAFLTGRVKSVRAGSEGGRSALDDAMPQGFPGEGSILNSKYISWLSGWTLSPPSKKVSASPAGCWAGV